MSKEKTIEYNRYKNMAICVCKYPILVIDSRNNESVEFLAMPVESIKGGSIAVPSIDYEQVEDDSGVVKTFVATSWQPLNHDNVKRYNVSGHIVIAGCEPNMDSEGHLKCDTKSIYKVLHPLEEWVNMHIVELS